MNIGPKKRLELLISSQRELEVRDVLSFKGVAYLDGLKTALRILNEDEGWIDVKVDLPTGNWGSVLHNCTQEVLIANTCSESIGFYDREDERWCVGTPAEPEGIDKITHWMEVPKNPHKK